MSTSPAPKRRVPAKSSSGPGAPSLATPYLRLSSPLPKGKGLMQLAINRLNETMGIKAWGFSTKTVNERSGKIKGSAGGSGGTIHELTVAVGIWIEERENVRVATGGAYGGVYADALEKAIEKAFLRSASLWGVGKEFYEGGDLPPTPESMIEETGIEIEMDDPDVTMAPSPQPVQSTPATWARSDTERVKATDLISRAEAKLEATKIAEEDGAPPSLGVAHRAPPADQPRHPDPTAPVTELQKQELLLLTQRAGRPIAEVQNFLAKTPNQAQAVNAIQTLKGMIKQKEMFVER